MRKEIAKRAAEENPIEECTVVGDDKNDGETECANADDEAEPSEST